MLHHPSVPKHTVWVQFFIVQYIFKCVHYATSFTVSVNQSGTGRLVHLAKYALSPMQYALYAEIASSNDAELGLHLQWSGIHCGGAEVNPVKTVLCGMMSGAQNNHSFVAALCTLLQRCVYSIPRQPHRSDNQLQLPRASLAQTALGWFLYAARYIGHLSGTRIPIVDLNNLKNNDVDIILIFAWNYSKMIIEKTKFKRFKYLVAFPTVQLVDNYSELTGFESI